MLKEFKQFIMRGNVLELAVGIVIGAVLLLRALVGGDRVAILKT